MLNDLKAESISSNRFMLHLSISSLKNAIRELKAEFQKEKAHLEEEIEMSKKLRKIIINRFKSEFERYLSEEGKMRSQINLERQEAEDVSKI